MHTDFFLNALYDCVQEKNKSWERKNGCLRWLNSGFDNWRTDDRRNVLVWKIQPNTPGKTKIGWTSSHSVTRNPRLRNTLYLEKLQQTGLNEQKLECEMDWSSSMPNVKMDENVVTIDTSEALLVSGEKIRWAMTRCVVVCWIADNRCLTRVITVNWFQ